MINNRLYPILTALPGRYARALFEVGKTNDCLDTLLSDFKVLEKFLSNNINYRNLLRNGSNKNISVVVFPVIANNLKLSDKFTYFVNLLITNRRFYLINKIESIFRRTIMDHKGEKEVAVYSAIKINKAQEKNVETVIQELFKDKKLIIKYGVKKELLTGIQIYSEGLIYDLSGSSSIRQLSNYLKSVSNI
ncbi:MAG: ATP synthase F1 subunit delta [Alphaproteobacteria bacterium]|nr:ATP synthase F1 subunit delta [Alphaproteobacteria bacterium]